MERIVLDTVVIGAGVVGLAVARALQLAGRDVLLLESQPRVGMGASSRNSEVIHAGIYYPPGSLKASLCVRGKHLLYDYCRARGVPYRQLGKLIVATEPGEELILAHYERSAVANGVHDLTWRSADEVRRLEPAIRGTVALHSPSTGILDSHQFMQALVDDFAAAGGHLVFGATVTEGALDERGVHLTVDDGGDCTEAVARTVVNAAGIHAPDLARRIAGVDPNAIPTPRYAIGHYYALSGASPFGRLVYPTAVKGGLGVHVTLDMGGSARFGPDVRWIDAPDYTFDDRRKPAFVEAIRRYYPDLDPDRLVPAYTGIRAKISGPADPAADFRIDGPRESGHPGLVHLFGIESPGLTASLAIAEHVGALLTGDRA
jgi:L-2-hydroxyglutarate oxidase LhgO